MSAPDASRFVARIHMGAIETKSMPNAPVPASLQTILADVFEISPAEVTPALSAGGIATWDSFRHLQAILALENEFNVQFDPARIASVTSVAEILEELKSLGVTFEATGA